MTGHGMQIGIFTLGDSGVDPARRVDELIEEIVLADQLGLDVFGLGEHHRAGFVTPAPAVVLAAAAARTNQIRLTSAVTVLGSDDPVRVFEQFTALDLVSGGRAEIMAGRGALLDSFRLFGHELVDYDALYDEKLRLLLALCEPQPVTWSGRFRPALDNETIMPRPLQDPLPVSVAVGGSPPSVIRAATLGVPLAIGTIGGQAIDFAPLADLYRAVLADHGHNPQPVTVTVHGFVADTTQRAAELYFPAEAELFNIVAGSRGAPPVTAAQMAAKNGPGSMCAVGSPAQVVDKLLHQHDLLGHQRVMLQLAVGPLPHRDVMRAIELLGTDIAPAVRAATAPSRSTARGQQRSGHRPD